MGPFTGYTSLTECVQFSRFFAMVSMFVMYVLRTVVSSNISHMHIFVVINLLRFFCIKLNMKMLKIGTFYSSVAVAPAINSP